MSDEAELTPAQRRAAEAVRDGKVSRRFPWTGTGAPRLDAPAGVSAGPLNRLVEAGLVRWRVDLLHGHSVHDAELTDEGRRAWPGGAS